MNIAAPTSRALFLAAALSLSLALGAATGARAQGASFGFGQGGQTDAPVEVESDSLSVNQDDGTAIFEGNVLIIQNAMRMQANRVQVVYDEAGQAIDQLQATGDVTVVSGEDAAEADRADYDVEGGEIVMTGNVLLTGPGGTIAAERAYIDLATGQARMDGRVRTVLQQGNGAQGGN